MDEYPVGRHFLARYNPNAPTEAVAEAGVPDCKTLFFAITFFAIAGAGLSYNFFQKFK